MVGVAPADDDANAASEKPTSKPVAVKATPAGFADWLTDIEAVADQGTPALQAAWKASKADYREYIDPKAWDAIKAKAAKVAA